MELFPDFYNKILCAFEKNHVRYLIIGGFATNFHGVIRSTLDMDLWVDNKKDNLKQLYHSLISLEYSENSCQQAIEAFKNNHLIKIFQEENLVELLDDFITKMDFDSAYSNRISRTTGHFMFHIIGLEDLIAMKSKTNRYRDLLDIKELEEIRKDRNL
jgi:predicted nucleotidyltransferase